MVMFKLDQIWLNNFRTYVGEHEFVFPSEDGLYFLTGLNLVEPALGSNGAGKSTFMDAITWCLYGRTTRGLKANEVLSWGSKVGASVTLLLTVGDATFKVKRTQKPNGLFIDSKPVDQQELETHIRLNYEAFTHSVLSPQFGEPFFSLLPGAKLSLFSDLNGLDFWLKKSDEASLLAREQESQLAELFQKISRTEGQIEAANVDISDLEVKSNSYESERKSKIKEIEKSALDLYRQIGKLTRAIEIFTLEKQATLIRHNNSVSDLTLIEQERDGLLDSLAKSISSKKELSRLIEEQKDRISQFKTLKGKCFHCGQQVKDDYRNHHVAKAVAMIVSLEIDLDYVSGRIKSMLEHVAIIKLDVAAATNKVQNFKSEISETGIAITEKKSKLATINVQLDNAALRLDEAHIEKNPYKVMLDNKVNDLLAKQATLEVDNKAYEKLTSDHIATSFWIKGFKRIRLFIIEQAFQTLEIEVNNCLAQLGMLDWQVTFDVERENKSGGITKGFIVLIKGPSNPETVRWENWSGGETQRLQLAGDLGLANLIMHQAGLESKFEAYDEPSTHLSSEGMMNLADMLHDRAINDGKCIWIVDHTSISNFGEFQAIITARKTSHGSSIDYEGTT